MQCRYYAHGVRPDPGGARRGSRTSILPASTQAEDADITCTMTSPSLSPAVLFARERRPADEPALVRALPELTPAVQAATFAVLAEHPDSPVLQDLVARFQEFGEGFQAIILRHVGGLYAALRGAIHSSAAEARLSAIELIARSQSGKDAYLLAEALRSSCPTTRERASLALRRPSPWGRAISNCGWSPSWWYGSSTAATGCATRA